MTDALAVSRYDDGKPILVMGGGIAGLTTALEAAEAGCEVILVERAGPSGRTGGADAPVLPETLPAHMRSGDQLSSPAREPAYHSTDYGGGGRNQGRTGRRRSDGADIPAFRHSGLHPLRRLR